MHVLVRIQMGRTSANYPLELRQLTGDLVTNSLRIVSVHNGVQWHPFLIFVNPFTQIEMKSNADLVVLARIIPCRGRRWLANHQTCAGHYPSFSSLNDPLVDFFAEPKIIGIDY